MPSPKISAVSRINPAPGAITSEIGTSGLKHDGGYIRDEYQYALQGKRGMATYREMGDSEPVLRAVLYAIETLCRQAEWDVRAADIPDDAPPGAYEQGQADRDFLLANMRGMDVPWIEVISEALTMCQFGHAQLEKIYERRDGALMWARLPGRSQETIERWEMTDPGECLGAYQQAPPLYKETFIPSEKLLSFRTRAAKRNPEGLSLLRGAYIPWYEKKHVRMSRMIGIRRDLCGLPVMDVPGEWTSSAATDDQKAFVSECKKIVTRTSRGEQEGVLIPLVYDANGNRLVDFRLMASSGSRQFDIEATIQSLNVEMAIVVIGDFILLGHEKVGSFALSDSKTHLFATATGAYLDIIASEFNTHGVPELFEVNGMEREHYPQITHGDLEKPDLAVIGTFLGALSTAGFPVYDNEELERKLLGYLGVKAEAKAAELPAPRPPTAEPQ